MLIKYLEMILHVELYSTSNAIQNATNLILEL